MLLRGKVTAIVVLGTLGITLAFGLVLWQRDTLLDERYREALRSMQQSAWLRLERHMLEELDGAIRGSPTGGDYGLRAAEWGVEPSARGRTPSWIDALANRHPDWRVEVFDAARRRVFSNAPDVLAASMLDAGWLARVLPAQGAGLVQAGLIQVSRDEYFWMQAVPLGNGDRRGALAVGMRVDLHLPELASVLDARVFLRNLRGRPVAGTGLPAMLLQAGADVARGDFIGELQDPEGRAWLLVSHVLTGPGGRAIGSLVALRDVTDRVREDRLYSIALAGGGVLLLALVFGLVYSYLRSVTEPLGRAVEHLDALARGDVDSGLDEADELESDEAGQISRGVSALRREMLNFQVLREERTRSRQQQERLIREQLRALAESLEPESREEIVRALEGDLSASGSARRDNHLAELAGILSRMSGLVTTQQARLLQLLDELRAAMASQALLVSLQQELEIARRMQLSILPRAAPSSERVAVAATMIPARDVGGDFYDYFPVGEHHFAIVVADVSGKGVPAAFFMAISRTLLKSSVLFLPKPAEVIAQLNNQLCAENEQTMFVTMFFGLLDLRDGTLTYVNAGHNPPVLLVAGQPAELVPTGRNVALAVAEGIAYQEGSLRMARGDALFLYTDGVTEATDPEGGLFGTDRLVRFLANTQVGPSVRAGLPERVVEAVRAFERGAAQADDITCVELVYVGGDREDLREVQ